ncbi:MAG: hypothetical protein LBQ58_01525 [Synergistaceae bacterium]|jgi:hypothetical protein|nr:hypothetical protein [Synergistaceae bacterium]
MKMTLKYSHLAPENKLQAVKALDRKRLKGNPIHAIETDLPPLPQSEIQAGVGK